MLSMWLYSEKMGETKYFYTVLAESREDAIIILKNKLGMEFDKNKFTNLGNFFSFCKNDKDIEIYRG